MRQYDEEQTVATAITINTSITICKKIYLSFNIIVLKEEYKLYNYIL